MLGVVLVLGALVGYSAGHSRISEQREEILECIQNQVEWFGDICAEASIGYERMHGSDAYYEGAKCAVESAHICVEQVTR